MGREARAKRRRWANGESVSRGNPDPIERTATVIAHDKFAAAAKAGQPLTATFSDRRYVMNRHGTLRRLPPAVPRVTVSVTHVDDNHEARTT